jgi:hypothetical protein
MPNQTILTPAGDWLAVSTDGFASMNAGRDPAHLAKELVQNALDAVDGTGEVVLTCVPGTTPDTLLVTCRDNGCGMTDLQQIRTVFFTSKTDSHLKRGRMGRGFKEMLCLARHAVVTSGAQKMIFGIENGRRIIQETPLSRRDAINGTLVSMEMPWSVDVIARLEGYFSGFLPPPGIRFAVNGVVIEPRAGANQIMVDLPTELFADGRWVRPVRKAAVELVPAEDDEPMVYELGIPVCPVEWTQKFHVNVLQRVPMNPGRDAVASGYLTRLHKCCLPVLLPVMEDSQIRDDWVGQVVPQCAPAVQQEVIRRAFGNNIARSVPAMGVRQFDEDARDLGLNIIDARHTSGGFREILQEHVPTSKQLVDRHQRERHLAAAGSGFLPDEAGPDAIKAERQKLIAAAGGKERVEGLMDFARWFCQKLLDGYGDNSICSVKLGVLTPVNAVATWGADDVLTLGIDTPWLWSDPLGAESLGVFIHECAHHENLHHGRDFHKELEALAGKAARLMLIWAGHVEMEYRELLQPPD